MAVLWGIMGILAYVLVVFIVKSIIFSFYDSSTLTGEIIIGVDTWTAPAVALLFCYIVSWILEDDNEAWYMLFIGISVLISMYLPYSVGAVILFNIINAGCVFCAAIRLYYALHNKRNNLDE